MDKAMHSDGKKKVSRFEFAIMQAAGIDQTNVEPKTKEEEIQERIDNLKNQASRIRIKNTSSSYIPTKEVPPEETAQALRTKFREKNIECEYLRSELQKQKELNAELRQKVRTYNQTLIARFYNEGTLNKDSLSKIIDEVEKLIS